MKHAPSTLVACGLIALGWAAFGGSRTPAGTGPAGGPPYIEGEILLRFLPGAGAADRSSLRAALHAVPLRRFESGAEHWLLGRGLGVERAVAIARRSPRVEYAEPNYRLIPAAVPGDPLFGDQWGLVNTGQLGGRVDADIDADQAWDHTTGSTGVVVAVLDTGTDLTHEDLGANLVPGWDFSENDANPSPYGDSLGGRCQAGVSHHGTHVAGIVGAVGDNGTGVCGVNWDVHVMPLRVIPGGVSEAAAAIDYARLHGAQVMNASWATQDSTTLFLALQEAEAAGILFVAAAMNLATNVDRNPASAVYPASYPLSNVIGVAATDRNDLRASFSNYGGISIDLGAPGVDVLSTVPNVGAHETWCGGSYPPGDHYENASGTSMATPHVAGAAALMRALDPSAGLSEIRCHLLSNTDPLPSLIYKTVSGGRLNARRALDSLAGGQPCTESTNFRMTVTLGGSGNTNLLSLPYNNVFQGNQGPERLCQAFGLGSTATVTQYDATTGAVNTHTCGKHARFTLTPMGVEIRDPQPGPKQGVVEGWEDPNVPVTLGIADLGTGTVGRNLFPVRYNGTASTPQDLCAQCGLSVQADVTRFDAATGQVQTHLCGQVPVWSLVLGEAVLIREPNGPKICTPAIY